MLGADQLRHYLTELGDELAVQGVRGDLFVVGGAAMALAYNTRRSTRDIDAVFEPKAVIYAAARRITARHPDELDGGWLNDAVKGLMLGPDPDATVVFQNPGLHVRVASPRYLFSMKVAASRVEQDDDDIAVLYRLCGFESVDAALAHIERTYPHLRLEPKSQYLLEGIVAADQEKAKRPGTDRVAKNRC